MEAATAESPLPECSTSSAPTTSRQQNRRRQQWAARLEEVLADFEALQRFQAWLGVDDDSSEHPLRLHFAIRAFHQMCTRSDQRAAQLAREIFNKFLRPRTGLCAFIDPAIRERVGQRLKTMPTQQQQSGEDLFDECLQPLDAFLRKQHALFVQSDDFLELFNNMPRPNPELQQPQDPCTSSVAHAMDPSVVACEWTPTARRSRRRDSNGGGPSQPVAAQLTASTLLRSQRDRQALVPAGGAGGLFKPVSRFPYVGQAQCSKKESAVSSSFSSEQRGAVRAGGGSLRQLRDNQRRVNQLPLLNTFPQPEPHCVIGMAHATGAAAPATYRHDTAEGRGEFAARLIQRLRHVEAQLQREESVNRQIDRLSSARSQGGAGTSARELIIDAAAALPEEGTAADEDADDDVENYLRRRMQDNGSSSAGSAQTPPLLLVAPQSRHTRRKSRASCSPGPHQQLTGTYLQQQQHMSQSCYHHPPPAFPANPFPTIGGMRHHFGLDHHQQMMSAPAQQHQTPYLGRPSPFMGPGPGAIPSGPPPPFFSPSSQAAGLSQSIHLSGLPLPSSSSTSSKPNPKLISTVAGAAYCDNDGDTSGIGSMTTTHSANSGPAPPADKQRAAMFRRARELSSGGGADQRNAAPGLPAGTPRGGTLPRPSFTSAIFGQPTGPKMVISYRDPASDGVPVVAHVPLNMALSFREFRRFLSISSKDRRQFFFKAPCEDGSAPYQWLLVSDDAAIVPVFENRVSAECRGRLSDSD